jgi:alpha-amylase
MMFMRTTSILSTAFVISSLCTLFQSAAATSLDEWRSRSVYQLITDRFARTDGDTTTECDLAKQLYCGGTWKGIQNKLDYIQGMGFTAVSSVTLSSRGR